MYDKKLAFKNNAPFISCVSKVNNTLIDNAEDLDTVIIVMLRDADADADPAVAAVNNPTNSTFNGHKIVCTSSHFIN